MSATTTDALNYYEGMFLIPSGRFASDSEGVPNELMEILEKCEAKVAAHECHGYVYDSIANKKNPESLKTVEGLFAKVAADAVDNMSNAIRQGYAWPFSSAYIGALTTDDGENYWRYVQQQHDARCSLNP